MMSFAPHPSLSGFRVRPFETAKGNIHNDLKEGDSDRTYLLAAYIDRHAFRARAKEVNHVDTVRLSERTRPEGQGFVCGKFGPVPYL
jgi:hypothetical protein